jgi:hypothetical protein
MCVEVWIRRTAAMLETMQERGTPSNPNTIWVVLLQTTYITTQHEFFFFASPEYTH